MENGGKSTIKGKHAQNDVMKKKKRKTNFHCRPTYTFPWIFKDNIYA